MKSVVTALIVAVLLLAALLQGVALAQEAESTSKSAQSQQEQELELYNQIQQQNEDTLIDERSSEQVQNPVVCVCECCYLGECRKLMNASWFVDSCADCTTQRCVKHISSPALRRKASIVFESLQEGVPQAARDALTIDVCEVVSVLETSTCAGKPLCKRTTDVKSECYDRHAWLHKTIIWGFALLNCIGLILGFTKNYIPALQSFNERHFNY